MGKGRGKEREWKRRGKGGNGRGGAKPPIILVYRTAAAETDGWTAVPLH